MPMVMGKKDWMQTVANVGNADGIWYENVVGDAGSVSVSLPEGGRYQVILIKVDKAEEPVRPVKKPRIADFIGYGARFHTPRPTEEWMKELREGEEE